MKSFIFAMVAVVFGVSICFAGDGVLNGIIIDLLKKVFASDPATAAAAYTVFLTLLGIGCRIFLKKVPGAGLGGLFWVIMKGLFGDGVILENNTDPKYLQEELSKKYPALDIRIKSIETAKKMAKDSPAYKAANEALK